VAIINNTRLTAVGPTSAENGFPLWYDDGTVLLELGDPTDPNTPAGLDELPSPGDPVAFPGNFPPEAFYSLVSAELAVGGTPAPGRARVVLALEATFGGSGEVVDGQQMVFARVRVRLRGGIPGNNYVFTHPYGQTDPLTADEDGDISVTEDLGAVPLDFAAPVRDGQVAPFLRWTSGAEKAPGELDPPDGYLGDGQTAHTITGSPLQIDGRTLNFFRLEGAGVGDVGGGPRDPQDPGNIDRIQTPLFTVQAKIATALGADIRRAVYTRTAAGTLLDVFAGTRPGQDLQVSGPDVAPTGLAADGGNYLARATAGPATPGATITVSNTTDVPPTSKTATAVDAVTITAADFDIDAGTLHVAAESSDENPVPTLTVTDVGPLPGGQADFPTAAPPATVEVTSAAGGSARRAVTVTGAALDPLPVVARAGTDQTVQQGQLVTLDGSASTGTPSWAQTAGAPPVVLSDPNAEVTTFAAPNSATDLTFTLTVTGPGGPQSDDVTVHVAPLTSPNADAGPDQEVAVGDTVTLDGSASTGTAGFGWAQLSGPPITNLAGADTAHPTFTMPAGGPVALVLTASGPGGADAVDSVTITALVDTIVTTRAQYRTSQRQWRVEGTSTGRLPNRITVSLAGVEIGTAAVDVANDWDVRRDVLASEPALVPAPGALVTVTSTRGGSQTLAVNVRN